MGSETRRPRKRGRLSRITASDVLASTRWFTPRDRQVCLDLYKHQVLAVHQIAKLHFPTPRKARERLLELTERGVLLRFQPQRSKGSAPFHYLLGELGAHIVSGFYGLEVKRLLTRLKEEDWQLAHSAKLPHLLETHDFFIALITRCREVYGFRLARWWSERRCLREWNSESGVDPMIRPDAHGILAGPSCEARFLLEVDRGTERGHRIAEKLESYGWYADHLAWLARVKQPPEPNLLLFVFPSARREERARLKLGWYQHLHVATSNRELHDADPLGANWAPIGPYVSGRVPLSDLPRVQEMVQRERNA